MKFKDNKDERLAYNKMSNNLGTRNSEQFDSDGLYPSQIPIMWAAHSLSVKYLVIIIRVTCTSGNWLVAFACLL